MIGDWVYGVVVCIGFLVCLMVWRLYFSRWDLAFGWVVCVFRDCAGLVGFLGDVWILCVFEIG